MSRAEDLFERVIHQGLQAVEDLIRDRQAEELFLDFKGSGDPSGTAGRLHDSDRRNLSRAISGFGNSAGGVLVWGVDCRNDRATGNLLLERRPIGDPQRFVSWLEAAISGCTLPPHVRVQSSPIGVLNASNGYAVTLIPEGQDAPYLSVQAERYLIRAGSDFVPAPHAVLAAMFGRRPQPYVFHQWVTSANVIDSGLGPEAGMRIELGISLTNQGRGIARDLFINSYFRPPSDRSRAGYASASPNLWTGQGGMFGFYIVSNDGFKLAPGAHVYVLTIQVDFVPPFTRPLRHTFACGCSGSPVTKQDITVDVNAIESAFADLVRARRETEDWHAAIGRLLGIHTGLGTAEAP